MTRKPDATPDQAVSRIIENIQRSARAMNLDFIPDPEKVRDLAAGYAASRERTRATVARMKQRTAD